MVVKFKKGGEVITSTVHNDVEPIRLSFSSAGYVTSTKTGENVEVDEVSIDCSTLWEIHERTLKETKFLRGFVVFCMLVIAALASVLVSVLL